MIRVIKPHTAAGGMIGGDVGEGSCPLRRPTRAGWSLTGGLHHPLKRRVLPTGTALAPSLISSGATIPCFSVKIKHETPVWISKHSPLAAGSLAASDLWGARLPWLISVVRLNSLRGGESMEGPLRSSPPAARGAGSARCSVEQDPGVRSRSWPAWHAFNPLPESKALNGFFWREGFQFALGKPMLNQRRPCPLL